MLKTGTAEKILMCIDINSTKVLYLTGLGAFSREKMELV